MDRILALGEEPYTSLQSGVVPALEDGAGALKADGEGNGEPETRLGWAADKATWSQPGRGRATVSTRLPERPNSCHSVLETESLWPSPCSIHQK